MVNSSAPIGVFDSGIGGLTVLEKLIDMFPHEDFIYVADQGYCPYGTKTTEQVGERVKKITEFLVAQGAKAIVIACNTASARIGFARAVTSIPVISVIQPTCARAIKSTSNNKVIVLATQGTIDSGIYQSILQKNGITVVALACGEFVDFLEHNDKDDERGEKIVKNKLANIADLGCDTLIHACTHFSLLEPQMRKVLGDINYIACGQPTGEYLAQILDEGKLCLRQNNLTTGDVTIYTTGEVANAIATTKWFVAKHKAIRHIEIK